MAPPYGVDSVQVANEATTFQFEVLDEDGAPRDVSSATVTKNLIFLKSDGTTALTKAASFVTTGTDGLIKCTLTAAELNQIGQWHWQAQVVLGSFTGKTETDHFKVLGNLT